MRNNKFWDEANNGSIRQKVAEFIDKTPLLSKLKGEKYYNVEDAIVAFIEENRQLIADEVDREYHREDLIHQVEEEYGKDAAKVAAIMPLERIDAVVDEWQETLADNDAYWEATWDDLSDALNELSVFYNVDNYDESDVVIYMAYLKEWYECDHHDMGQDPACIDEFFNDEMEDPEMNKYFTELAEKLASNDKKDK